MSGHNGFIYDKAICDQYHRVRIDVTVVDLHSDIMLTLKSGSIQIPVFLITEKAMELAAALTNAVCAYDRAVAKAE